MEKKILLLIDNLGAGGAQRQLVGLANMLKDKKKQVQVVVYQDIPFYLPFLQENDVDYKFLKAAQNKYLRLYHVYKAIRRYGPMWVIAYLDTPCIIACLCKLLGLNFKLLVSERNTSQKLSLREKIKFSLYKVADAIIPNSYSQEEFIYRHYPLLKDKMTVIPNFVDIEYFKKDGLRKRKGIPEILIIATIWQSKNTLGFIDAVKILKDRDIKCRLKWFGKIEAYQRYISKCELKIREYQLEDYIKLYNKTENIKEMYLGADYFCLPSFYEGTPNVICEAISCGLPVACSNVCDNERYVQTGINGFLFDPNNPEDIAEKILSLISLTDNEYLKMSENSRKIAETYLSESRFIHSYISVISNNNRIVK